MRGSSHARELASGVLTDLGLSTNGWRVIDVVESEDSVPPPRAGLSAATHFLITVGGPDDNTLQAYFTDEVERPRADVATAEQLQDHAIELLGGAAVPPCPDHPHPLQAQVVDGVPMWVCPLDPGHHRAPLSGVR